MKYFRKAAAALAVICLFAVISAPVFAAEEEYGYTVRIYSGKQGKINGSNVAVYENLKYGERITFHQNSVTLNDNSKYYVLGLRESGRDNSTSGMSSFAVTRDMDFVVAYGLMGSSVAYTVNYVDAAGNVLAESETYYGNVGDRPVVAFLYVEGYQPQAYNLTATLKENAAENVFTFVYTRLTAANPGGGSGTAAGSQTGSTQETSGTGSAQSGGGNDTGGNQTGGSNADGNAADGENAGADAPEEDASDGNDADENAADSGEDSDSDEEPQELLNLDDEEVPLAGGADLDQGAQKAESEGAFSKIPTAVKAVFAAAVLAALAAAVCFVIRKKRKKNNE